MSVLVTFVVLAACSGGVTGVAAPSGSQPAGEEQVLLDRAPGEAAASGCDPVQTTPPYDPEQLDRAHVGASGLPSTMPPLDSYPTQPPASGPHAPVPLGSGVYFQPVPVDATIHSMEHGAVIVWFSKEADAALVAQVQEFFQLPSRGTKVIVSTYDFPDQPGGKLPAGKQMAMVAWHRIQLCDRVSLSVAFDFVAHYRSEPSVADREYLGEAPEPSAPIDP